MVCGWSDENLLQRLILVAMTKLIGVSSPAAGAGFSYPSTGVALQSLRFRLVTSAAVANRLVTVSFDDFGGVPYYAATFPAQVASTTLVYQLTVGVSRDAAAIAGYINAPLPPGFVLNAQGQFFRALVAVAAIDVADQIDQIILSAYS